MIEEPKGEIPVPQAIATLQAIADPVRWKILTDLSLGTQCVCDLQKSVEIAANLLSYHLKVLRDNGLVTAEKRGRWVDYTLAEGASDLVRAALPGALANL